MKKSDIIIIGAGPGGYEMAIEAARKGLHVTIIESSKIGGTCLNEGCIPTKTFCRNAKLLDDLKEVEIYGLKDLSYTFDFSKVIQRKNEIVASLQTGIMGLLNNPLITLVHGIAKFKDITTLIVTPIKDETLEETEYTADDIIIATGSVTKFLPIEGAHLPSVITSREMLDMDHLPTSLCIIGGGVIGMEFADIFNSFGVEVTVVEFCKEILPNFDTDIAKRLKQTLGKKGINILTNAAARSIHMENGKTFVAYEQKGKMQEVTAELVLMAVGRTANWQSLQLTVTGVETNKRGIMVNEKMETNIPHIYAVGDVNGRCMLAHVATFQGKRALNSIIAKKNGCEPTDNIRLDIVPAAVFTHPEAAMVGLTEDYCKANNVPIIVKKSFFRANGKALAMNETDGMVKLIASATDGKLLGCHLFGAHAADLVQEVSALICKGTTTKEFCDVIHGHPTLGEVIQAAAQQFEE